MPSAAAPPPPPSTASNEERFRYHLSLELRRHGIEPTPALVETALRTHHANLAANTSASAAGADAKPAPPAAPKATPAPEFAPEKLPAASPSSASDSTDAPTPPHDPEWDTYINDVGLADSPSPMAALAQKPLPKIKQEPAASPLLPASSGGPNPFLADMDFDPSWSLDMAPSPSPLHLDPLAPHLGQPGFAFSPGAEAQAAPPPYNPHPTSRSPGSAKLEDTPMAEAGFSPSPTAMTSHPSGHAPAASSASPSAAAPGVDPTSIDPRLVQMTLAEQIQLQLQVLQELQSQSFEQGLSAASPPPSAEARSASMAPPPSNSGSSSKPSRGARKGIPASMSALDVADRPSAEEWKALSSKEKRQLRNKISARNFRERRKEYITQLEDILVQRDAAIESIRSKNASLVTENQRLKALLEQHNIDTTTSSSSASASASASSSPAATSARPVSATPRATAATAAAPAPAPAAAPSSAPVPSAASPSPAPAPAAGMPAVAKGPYDVAKILELLRRTQTAQAGACSGAASGSSRAADAAPRLSRQSSAQGLDVPSLNLAGLNSLNIPLSSGPSTPLPLPLTGSPSPRFAEPMVNTKKDVAYPSSPRTLGRAQSFFAGRSNGSSGSFAAPITQVHSMFAPPLPVAPFLAPRATATAHAGPPTHTKLDAMASLTRAFDLRCAAARAEAQTHAQTHARAHAHPQPALDGHDLVRTLAAQAAAECLADASVPAPRSDGAGAGADGAADGPDGLPSYAQALRSPVLLY